VGFGRACAPVRCAHPSLWVHCHAKTGRCAPPPANRSFAASYSNPKNIYNLSKLGRPRQGLFSFHWTTEAVKYEAPCPPSRPSQLLILPTIFLGSTYVPMRPCVLILSLFSFFCSFWIFSFCYSLFLLSFTSQTYPSI
jgi:hypothetical protein